MRMIEASTPQRKGRGEEGGKGCTTGYMTNAETQGNDESDTLHRVGLCTPQGTWGRGVGGGGWLRETGAPYSRSK